MAAVILDEQPSNDDLDNLPADDAVMTPDEVVSSFTESPAEEAPTSIDDDLPEKYRGKSIQEIVSMHQEAEKVIGRQGGEVGELRSVVDEYIRTQIASQTQPEQADPEPVDFFDDPQAAVSQAIERHPDVIQAKQTAQESKQNAALNALRDKHPDMPDVVNSPAFAEWVKGSPIRTELYARADANFDYDAADELISTFKERTKAVAETTQVETAARQQQLRAAQTGSASGAGTSGAKRVYRRADIIKLMKTDPDRYDALSTEIMQAYAEGRVK
jgi:hypothetical protein